MSKRPRRDRAGPRPAAQDAPSDAADAAPPPLPGPPRRRPWLLALSVAALAAWFAALLGLAWRD